jgi:hypothetical protein
MMMIKSTLFAAAATIALATGASAQDQTFFAKGAPAAPVVAPYTCTGPIKSVVDVGDENVHTTNAVYPFAGGGGEAGNFDPKPLLTTKVTLVNGDCLNAHLSALVGGKVYGASNLAMFEVTLTRNGRGTPRHMYGHYETPYGIFGPAVAVGAEPDVDQLAANFIQHVGKGTHDVPPGSYVVNVWWVGAPPGNPNGAIGAAFVLKLYTNQ